MKIRLFKTIWALSALWVALPLLFLINANQVNGLVWLFVGILLIPTVLGLVVVYIGTGSFKFPCVKTPVA